MYVDGELESVSYRAYRVLTAALIRSPRHHAHGHSADGAGLCCAERLSASAGHLAPTVNGRALTREVQHVHAGAGAAG